jgi:phage FluMu gp28-like protein
MNEIEIKLPRPHKGQHQVINSQARFKILLSGRRWGKTLTAQIICIQKMLAGQQVAYVTPTYDLSKAFFLEMLKVLPSGVVRINNKTDLIIELVTGGNIKFFSGESLQRFRGYRFHYLIIDEAAFISDLKEAWYSAMRPTLSDHQGGALFISTPKNKEFFYSLFLKGNDPLESEYESFHFTSNDNPYFPEEEFEAARQSLPSFQFNTEYLAIAGESSSNPFGLDNINRNTIHTFSNEPTIVYGIDFGRVNDYTVITGLDINGHTTYFDRFLLPWELTKNKVEQLPSDVFKVVDATGVGDVLFEDLSLTCSNISGFKFTGESKPKIIYELIRAVEKGGIKYNQTTADEMMVFQYSYGSTGHIKFGAQSGYHDDCIMSLALANHHRLEAVQLQDWKLYFA